MSDLEDIKYDPHLITLKIKSFSIFRDIIGKEQIILQLPRKDGARRTTTTIADLKNKINELYPAISAQRIVMAVAINAKMANDNTILNDFDEIALLPPISGG